ncbi:MAG: RIP metalloprotease RseP [Alistipes sp.]|jgi:regulator of sigma E protease|nr:RIP metalloprotease RseP [Alistipes sp.]MBQ5624109.1 RIP metalloprotease RseP [Alistipes sp.]
MEILIKIIQVLMSLSLLVAIHEFGHYIVARIFKIRVEKFYIFFDPWFSLFKWKKGETEYGIGWVPLGGYVKIAGMIDESMDLEQMKAPIQPYEFRAKPAWQRLMVMLAGVTMNVLLAMLIYTGIRYVYGESYLRNEDAKWGYTFSEAGERLGFRDGDKVISVDGEVLDGVNDLRNKLLLTEGGREVVVNRGGEQVSINISFDDLLQMRRNREYETLYELRFPFIIDSVASESALAAGLKSGDEIVAFNGVEGVDAVQIVTELLPQIKGDTVALKVNRAGSEVELRVPVNAEGKMGVVFRGDLIKPHTREYGFFEAIPAGVKMAGQTIANYWEQLKLIFTPKTKMYEELGGFIAIGNIFPSEFDWLHFWTMTAFLSIMLAVLNVMPIPGLDGGHALFTLWEMITGRKPSEKFLEIMQYIGLMILLALLVYANGNDIYRLFK